MLHCHFVVIEFDRKLGFATSDGNLEFVVCTPVTQRPFAKVQIILQKFCSSREPSDVVAGSLTFNRQFAN